MDVLKLTGNESNVTNLKSPMGISYVCVGVGVGVEVGVEVGTGVADVVELDITVGVEVDVCE